MTDVASPIFLDEGIESVERLGINMVQPCTEDPVASELSSQLVGIDVVPIIGTGAVMAELTYRGARNVFTGQSPYGAVRLPGLGAEPMLHV